MPGIGNVLALLSGVTKSREASVVRVFGVLGFLLAFGVGVLLSGVTKSREASEPLVWVCSFGAFLGGLGVARSISAGAKILGVGAPSKPTFED